MAKLKKLLKFFIGVIAAVYLILIKIEIVLIFFRSLSPKEHPELANYVIDILVCIAIVVNYKVTVSNPEKKYEKAKLVRYQYLQNIANKVIDELKSKGYDVDFNVMSTKWKFYPRLEPDKDGSGKRYFYWPWRKVFKCDWTSSDDYLMPPNFVLGAEQGTSGRALKNKDTENNGIVVVDVEKKSYEYAREEMNLNRNQFGTIKNLTLLASVIIQFKENETTGESKVIGILTMQSKSAGLGKIWMDSIEDYPEDVRTEIMNVRQILTESMDKIKKEYRKLYF